MSIYNPNESSLETRLAAVEAVLRSNLLRHGSFGSDGILVYDGGRITFVAGGGIIIEGDGTIDGSGALNWAGTAFFDGPMEITDTLKVLAETTLEGLVKLMNNLELVSGGKITSGNVVIDPSDTGGTVKVGNLRILVTGGGVNISAYGHQIVFNSSGISIVTAGGKSIVMQSSPSAFRLGGLPTIPRASANNATIGTVYSDASGNLSRVI